MMRCRKCETGNDPSGGGEGNELVGKTIFVEGFKRFFTGLIFSECGQFADLESEEIKSV